MHKIFDLAIIGEDTIVPLSLKLSGIDFSLKLSGIDLIFKCCRPSLLMGEVGGGGDGLEPNHTTARKPGPL